MTNGMTKHERGNHAVMCKGTFSSRTEVTPDGRLWFNGMFTFRIRRLG